MSRCLRIVLAVYILLGATTISAAPTRLRTARFSGNCDEYTIVVTGEGLMNQPNLIVGYNIMLSPRVGEPIAITDSFPLVSTNGSFRQTATGSWRKFEIPLSGKYTLSGSANLLSNLDVLSSAKMIFAKPTLTCRPK